MSTTKTVTIEDALKAAKTLPDDAQSELAQELVALVEDYRASGLTSEQREIVRKRLADPRTHVSRSDFLAMLRRYNPAV